jgi:hypothetical protein
MLLICLMLLCRGAELPRYHDRLPPYEVEARMTVAEGVTPAIDNFTQVTLDGAPCRYRDVPKGSTITSLDVAADLKRVNRIAFASKP